MKKFSSLLAAGTLVAAFCAVGPALAQDGNGGTDGAGRQTTVTTDDRRNDTNYSWLGLLGLAGLAGLRRPAPQVVHHDDTIRR